MKKELAGTIIDSALTENLLTNVSELAQALKNVDFIPKLAISTLITSTLKLSTQIFRQITDEERIEDLGSLAAISCSLRERLHFYWRWISENKPELNPRISELIRSQEISRPTCWIFLDVTDRDQPILIAKQVDRNFCNAFSPIYSAIKCCEFEHPKVLVDSQVVTRQLKLGSLVIVQSSWFESDRKKKSFWREKLFAMPQIKRQTHFNLYTVYSSKQ